MFYWVARARVKFFAVFLCFHESRFHGRWSGDEGLGRIAKEKVAWAWDTGTSTLGVKELNNNRFS